jgi:hypothetical protein
MTKCGITYSFMCYVLCDLRTLQYEVEPVQYGRHDGTYCVFTFQKHGQSRDIEIACAGEVRTVFVGDVIIIGFNACTKGEDFSYNILLKLKFVFKPRGQCMFSDHRPTFQKRIENFSTLEATVTRSRTPFKL